MRYIAIVVAGILLAGCSTKGPGSDCDSCATAEANPVGENAQAAAAAASGGQRANQAPFSGEAGARLDPMTTVGRGAGDTTASSADVERRSTASGGAQNLALLNPATASASTGGGGVSAAVQEAQKTVASWRAALMLAMTDSPVDMTKLDFVKGSLVQAQADLNAAAAAQSSNRPNVTHVYKMGGDNTIIGYSRAGNGEGPDSVEATKALGEAAAQALARDKKARAAKAVLSKTKPAAPEFPEPAGAAEKDGAK